MGSTLRCGPHRRHETARLQAHDPDFLKIGSSFVAAAPLPLAVGNRSTYVAAGRALQSDAIALLLAPAALIAPLIFWYVLPAWRRLAP
jgi:hypothetical protein